MRNRNRKKSAIYSIATLLVSICVLLVYVFQYFQDRLKAGTDNTANAQNVIQNNASVTEANANTNTKASHSLTQIPYIELPRLTVQRSEQVIEHLGYTVSYNPQWNIPNWVAYELTNVETSGAEQRKNHFKPDPLVKGDPVVTKDYSNSGYDRGHMAPAADMRWSEKAMKESFYMTNMCPQLHSLNAGDWKSLEELARDWAKKYGNIYIATGPIVGRQPQTIGKARKIVVPEAFYKVFLRRKDNGEWASIGFVMENKAVSKPLLTYMQSVDEVEKLTGIDFFYNLPDDIEERIEVDFNVADWTIKK